MADAMPNPAPPQQERNNPHSTRGSRNRRRPRGAVPRSNAHGAQSQEPVRQVNSGRQFGGQLTRLHADAPAFVPGGLVPASVAPPAQQGLPTSNRGARNHTGKQSQPRNQNANRQTQPPSAENRHVPRERRASMLRSKASDIATRTHEDIANGIYECAICTNEISRNSKVWSCRTCWTVFHIGCIKKWSKNEGSAVARPAQEVQGDQSVPAKQWRCPGCNLPKDTLPTSYSCWCEKDIDPKAIPGVPPHSCGQSCGRAREFPKVCPHPCDLTCHAGPCPPCSHMGPEQSCFCGKRSVRRRCIETDYEHGWSCEEPCGDLMPCGQHTCPRPCHEGMCGDCDVEVDARCYCGKVEKTLPCNAREEELESRDWTGVFNCHQTCDNMMDCGLHQCEKECHALDEGTPHCLHSPDMISYCPCGKTALSNLQDQPRKACTDPIPNCSKACEKLLACGHSCPQVCHLGECPPCRLVVKITCRCGRNTFDTTCHQGQEEHPQCMRVCRATLNCGRHECGERCCTGERKAADRQATRRKMRPLGVPARMLDDGIEAEHICTRPCGRLLKCGNHTCQDLCHKGPCNSCREAIFEDISCDCGRTTLQAPLPCGTQPPLCTFSCRRDRACGHPQVAHNCHFDTEPCPPCPFLVEKQCMCGKKVLKNQSCFRNDVPCGLVCGKRLKCGSHTCQKLCHRPGECEDATSPCQQQCGKPKKVCGHPCEKTCHAPYACKEDKLCPSKIIITCDCQRRKEEVRCNARAGTPASATRTSSLKCDDECARLIRNAQLAQALNIPDGHQDDHIPYSNTTLSLYSTLDQGWTHAQESTLRVFAADESERRLRFKPMKNHQRAFIHAIAEDFGLDGESVDPEPHRHVVLFKTPKFVSAPMKTLTQAARIRRIQVANVTSATDANETSKRADEAHPPYNGFIMPKPRFALTIDEVASHILNISANLPLNVHFMTQRDAIVLLAHPAAKPKDLEQQLIRLRPSLEAEIKTHNLAESVLLCSFDTASLATAFSSSTTTDPTILYQQDPALAALSNTSSRSIAASGGWSQVAAKASASPKRLPPQQKQLGQKPVYTVLGSRLAEYKKRKEEEENVKREEKAKDKQLAKTVKQNQGSIGDNWEDEVEEDEADNDDDDDHAPPASPYDAGGAGTLSTGDDEVHNDIHTASVPDISATASGVLTPASTGIE